MINKKLLVISATIFLIGLLVVLLGVLLGGLNNINYVFNK